MGQKAPATIRLALQPIPTLGSIDQLPILQQSSAASTEEQNRPSSLKNKAYLENLQRYHRQQWDKKHHRNNTPCLTALQPIPMHRTLDQHPILQQNSVASTEEDNKPSSHSWDK